MTEKLLCILVPSDGEWSACFPDYPGCVAFGKTVQETRQRAAEAIAWHLEGEPAVTLRTLEAHVRDGLDIPADALFAYVAPAAAEFATA